MFNLLFSFVQTYSMYVNVSFIILAPGQRDCLSSTPVIQPTERVKWGSVFQKVFHPEVHQYYYLRKFHECFNINRVNV